MIRWFNLASSRLSLTISPWLPACRFYHLWTTLKPQSAVRRTQGLLYSLRRFCAATLFDGGYDPVG
jgi:hypothetical protein